MLRPRGIFEKLWRNKSKDVEAASFESPLCGGSSMLVLRSPGLEGGTGRPVPCPCLRSETPALHPPPAPASPVLSPPHGPSPAPRPPRLGLWPRPSLCGRSAVGGCLTSLSPEGQSFKSHRHHLAQLFWTSPCVVACSLHGPRLVAAVYASSLRRLRKWSTSCSPCRSEETVTASG